jgi:hypothetical protein
MRKVGDTYYFIYSSINYHELCYATSDSPVGGFRFRGTIVSNNDKYIDSYKPAGRTTFYGGNNHGSIAEIGGKWYIFYHRHTNGTNFSRQACVEPIEIRADGSIPQVMMTSCGSNGGPLAGRGEYPAYIACNLFCDAESEYTAAPGDWMDCRFPKITQDGKDGDEIDGHIENMRDSATAGFKYFECEGVKRVSVTIRGDAHGSVFEVCDALDGEPLGEIPVGVSTDWKTYSAEIPIPDGIKTLYFRYRGKGRASLKSFTLA